MGEGFRKKGWEGLWEGLGKELGEELIEKLGEKLEKGLESMEGRRGKKRRWEEKGV